MPKSYTLCWPRVIRVPTFPPKLPSRSLRYVCQVILLAIHYGSRINTSHSIEMNDCIRLFTYDFERKTKITAHFYANAMNVSSKQKYSAHGNDDTHAHTQTKKKHRLNPQSTYTQFMLFECTTHGGSLIRSEWGKNVTFIWVGWLAFALWLDGRRAFFVCAFCFV